jgi:growth factor-regulated tyrosine kinase substrate
MNLMFQALESCVKNCGSIIHEEIATKEFMEFLKEIAKVYQLSAL